MKVARIVEDEDRAARLAAAMVRRSMWFELAPQPNVAYLFTFKDEHQAWVEQQLTHENNNAHITGDKHGH